METVGRYQFLRKLGSGGMAEVYLAKRAGAQGIDKLLVVKRVLPAFAQNERFLSMFVDEAKVAMRLNHPNIVQVYAFDEVGDDRLLAMEFVDGTDLARLSSVLTKSRQRISFPLAAYVAQESAKGLDYAHSRRDERGEPMEIVHRDVSPQNLLISYDGAVKVTDFGIAKARMVTDEEGVIKGKFAYMSPEQASGHPVDRRSDVWSLGVVLYEMLVGKTLFGSKAGMEALELIRNADIAHIKKVAADVPDPLAEIVMRALVRDRDQRYQSAREMGNALARFLHAQPEVCDAATLEAYLQQVAPRSGPDSRAMAAEAHPARVSSPPEVASIDTNAETLLGSTPGRPPRELRERQNIVVVAGELRGYDRLCEQAGSAAARAALVEFLRMLGDIAYKNDAMAGPADEGGFLLFFGLDHSSVHDPLRAVGVGLDVLEALEGLSRDLASSALSLGVGINRGQALCVREPDGRLKRYEPQGPVIVVAETLANHARDGALIVGGGVYRLARRDFNFEEGDQIEVPLETVDGTHIAQRKTDTAPNAVRAYRFLSAKTREERMREAAADRGGLIGRELELRSLSETFREVVTTGRSTYLAITGEMGIGKTALLTTFLSSQEVPGPRILRAECTFATLDVPFGAAMELVRDASGIVEDDTPEALREKLNDAMERLFADAPSREREETLRALGLLFDVQLGEAPVLEAPEAAERYRITLGAVRHLLDRLARKGPVLAIVENAQWADRASLDLLRELAKRSYPLPILGIVLCRPDDRLSIFLEGIARVNMTELEREDRKRLILDRLGGGDDTAELRTMILAKGGGNPFFILEIIESLIDRDILGVELGPDGRKVLRLRNKKGSVALPTTLEGVIAARIDELPPDERMVLRWAAIAGSVFREKLIADLSGLDVSRELRRLIKRGLLELGKKGEVRFRHAVVREVAYGGLDPADRARMHGKIGERLVQGKSARGAGAARVARHLELAGDALAAAKHYLEAADAARALYSNREALHFYGKASQLLPLASKDRFLAHERREQILRGMGRRREQLAELEALRKIATAASDASQMALALNRLGRFYVDIGRSENAAKAVQAALDVARRAGDRGAEVEALRIMAAVHRDVGEYAQGIECCDRALELLGTGPEALTQRGTVLIQKGILLRQTGRLRESLQTYAEALVIYRRLGIKRLQSQTLANMGVASTSMGEYEDAIALYRQSLALDREIGDRYALGSRLANIGQAYGEMGERARALSYLRKSVAVHEAFGDRSGMADALLTISEVEADGGIDNDAQEVFARALALADTGGDTYDRARARVVGADLELRAGRPSEAKKLAEEGVGISRSAGLRTFEAHALSIMAEAQQALGEHAAARDAAAEAVAIAVDAGRLERAERIYFAQYRVLADQDDEPAAVVALTRAEAELGAKAERFRSAELRRLYLSLPLPSRIMEATRKNPALSKAEL